MVIIMKGGFALEINHLSNCRLCPRECSADRAGGRVGYCKAGTDIKIARAALHQWEEPPVSGTQGSGAVFFSYCNLGCVFCQNYKISKEHRGRSVSVDELCKIFLDLQTQGAHNINLVTPTHYIPQIAEALIMAKKAGLDIPILYNCGGYESAYALKLLDGLIDIYMPDVKYASDKYAVKYSNAPNYFEYAKKALEEMYRQVGKPVLDDNGIMQRGMLVRHMLLPGLLFDSKKILDYLYATFGDNIYISIMNQYTPMPCAADYPEINKRVDKRYYEALVDYAEKLGITNAFVQSGEAVGESFIPEFYSE